MLRFSRRNFLHSAGAAGLALPGAGLLTACNQRAAAPRYLPTVESLNTHPAPTWFEDGKLGIFLHWGLYSVPGFAPKGRLEDVMRTNIDRVMVMNPYAEDYWNAMRDPTTPTAEFHRRTYGDLPYEGFREMFNAGLEQWDAEGWAREFKQAGAGYVVLTAKYADGYCLWPSSVRNPFVQDWESQRDVVGELASACRAQGLRFGVYYSGGVDWSYRTDAVRTLGEYINGTPAEPFAQNCIAHIHELIDRYSVDVLWNDICWCTDTPELYQLFADYYNKLPEGAVNDRWSPLDAERRATANPEGWAAINEYMRQAVMQRDDLFAAEQPAPPHCDFRTPEWTQFNDIREKKWEVCRGLGTSWGYNRTETDADYETGENLTFSFIDAVSKNGNMLLNLGPRGEDAQIPGDQLSRLREMGAWIQPNSAAIHGTRPWRQADAETAEGTPVRFTQKDGAVNVIVWGRPQSQTVRIKGVALGGEGRHLRSGANVGVSTVDGDTVLTFAAPLAGELGPTVAITPA